MSALIFQVAERIVQGQVPYADFALEYPPAALIPIVLPYLSWPIQPLTFETYQWLFVAQSALDQCRGCWHRRLDRQSAGRGQGHGARRIPLHPRGGANRADHGVAIRPVSCGARHRGGCQWNRRLHLRLAARRRRRMAAKVFPGAPCRCWVSCTWRQGSGRRWARPVVIRRRARSRGCRSCPRSKRGVLVVQWQQERPIQVESIQGAFTCSSACSSTREWGSSRTSVR